MSKIAVIAGSLYLWLSPGLTMGQRTSGLIGVPDTSFTVHSAYSKAKKTHPDIRIAAPALPPTVQANLNVVYCNQNGRDLHIDAFYPVNQSTNRNQLPAVLLIHGGGWRSGDRSQQIPMAQQLATNGYVAVTAEYRLSTEALYPAAVHDLKAAIRWLRTNAREYNIDPDRIAILGCSAGGQLAALLGTTGNRKELEGTSCHTEQSSAVQAIVDVDGVLAFIHPESGEGDDSRSTSAATYWFGASKTEKPKLWHEASALTYVDKSTPPILFLNSSVDRMHAGRDDMIGKLNALGIYSEVHTFADAPHPFWLFHPWFEPTVSYTVNFLNKVFSKK
ncbi:hypothetical protein GCM10023189_18180 [Nibrella saemangeumensis]|uniref:BD-FAE-like domain-containing protein n=1 Tax=Nibrella saemangeumensis TaxID=1084526 RepID=A0ABP8MN81_9BACT